MPWEIPTKICLLAVAILFLFTFFNLILDAPRISKGGQANFFLSPQIVNSQILVLILLSQIRKYLRYASPQIANLQIFMNNPEIANPLIQNTALLYLATVLKVVFVLSKSAKQKKDWVCNLFADRPPLCIRFYFPLIT